MKEFKEYYQADQIIKYLCKIRIKYAQKRNKKYLLDKLTTKEFYIKEVATSYDEEIISALNELLPKRRLWLSNGQRTFKEIENIASGVKERIKIPTDEKNREILFNTIKRLQKTPSKFDFIIKLNEFIKDIQYSIESETYKITPPNIFPEVKETNKSKLNLELRKGGYECRPISRFTLKDRIILSLTNKFLTETFDDFFEESSLAFRAKKDSHPIRKNHHTAINRIIDFKKKNKEVKLYVAECDMKKFYDTVNHQICINSFDKLITKARNTYPDLYFNKAIYIFKEYLNCYSFEENISNKLNGNIEYWKNQKKNNKSINGFFPWVTEDIENSEYYKINRKDRIGVPQGGALSGLIANIVLDNADKKLKQIDNLFYVRYCDDMILMHTDFDESIKAIRIYENSIKDLQLFNHEFSAKLFEPIKSKSKRNFTIKNGKILYHSFDYSIQPFWNSKSKGPYRWGKIDIQNNTFPWIAFVGYEINHEGKTRIRKKSLKKELAKQKKIVTSIIKRIKKKKNARNRKIYKSATEKLNGMSVGRIKLYNYKISKNEFCWADGFQCLNLNSHSSKQLKSLDRNKYKFLSILKQHLGLETIAPKEPESNDENFDLRKPFSYYYQAGEKKVKQNIGK